MDGLPSLLSSAVGVCPADSDLDSDSDDSADDSDIAELLSAFPNLSHSVSSTPTPASAKAIPAWINPDVTDRQRAAITPSASSFSSAFRFLATEAGHIDSVIDAALASFAPATLHGRSTSWNAYVAMSVGLDTDPLTPSQSVFLATVSHSCRTSPAGRPGGSVNSLKVSIRLLGSVHSGFAAHVPPNSLLCRASRGLVIKATTSPVLRQEYLDMPRVLRLLADDFDTLYEDGEALFDENLDDEVELARRDTGIASVAATLPSRPNELASLRLFDVTFVVHSLTLGQRSVAADVSRLQ